MSLFTKAIQDITKADIDVLLQTKAPEGKHLEYKRDLPGPKDSDKKEFLFDISSIANSHGGHVLYGIDERNGLPHKIAGVPRNETDQAVLRLQDLVRDGIRPPLIGVDFHPVFIDANTSVLLVKIPPSWAAPHQVIFQKTFRFYKRSSNGKYMMDVDELRDAFLLTYDREESIRKFRNERVQLIAAGSTPKPLTSTSVAILHLIPIPSFGKSRYVDLSRVDKTAGPLSDLLRGGGQVHYNLDGLLVMSSGQEIVAEFLQLYRSGILELCWVVSVHNDHDGNKLLPSESFEQDLVNYYGRAAELLRILGTDFPLAVFLSVAGMKGCKMGLAPRYMAQTYLTRGLDRDPILIPESVVSSFSSDPKDDLAQVITMMWNAAGFAKSIYE
ncbi:MAG: ATP-binding protein [Gammaproteobacteria bacterium]|nr:ATP-binding protein [Gammaproteobacteria bacterium]